VHGTRKQFGRHQAETGEFAFNTTAQILPRAACAESRQHVLRQGRLDLVHVFKVCALKAVTPIGVSEEYRTDTKLLVVNGEHLTQPFEKVTGLQMVKKTWKDQRQSRKNRHWQAVWIENVDAFVKGPSAKDSIQPAD